VVDWDERGFVGISVGGGGADSTVRPLADVGVVSGLAFPSQRTVGGTVQNDRA